MNLIQSKFFNLALEVYHFFRDGYARLTWWPHHWLNSPLLNFRLNHYSMMGEDGIIAEIFSRVGIKGGWLVEFGASDGKKLSNTYWLLKQSSDFRAVYIESEDHWMPELKKTEAELAPRLIAMQAFVAPDGESSLDNLLAKTPIPKDFELLSIDVDSTDYKIWKSLKNYSPKVVVIEINSQIPPLVPSVHGEAGAVGSSFFSTLILGMQKGYACVCHNGNMFFVRNDLMPRIHLRKKYLVHPEKLFYGKWCRNRFGSWQARLAKNYQNK